MKCTQKAEKKLFLEGDLFMDGGKRASVRNIVISVLLIVVGIAMLMLVTEGIKSGWYDAHSARPAKRKGYAALLPVLLVLLGGFNLYRGLRGKAFQMDISSMFSGHKVCLSALRRAAAAGAVFLQNLWQKDFLRFSDGKNRGIFSKKYDFLAADPCIQGLFCL